jgi:hypothetical protein
MLTGFRANRQNRNFTVYVKSAVRCVVSKLKNQNHRSLTLAARNEGPLVGESYRTATVTESVLFRFSIIRLVFNPL